MHPRNILLLGIGIIVVTVGSYLFNPSKTPDSTPAQHACTLEAKLCPDGSAVGRTGPNCEFAACPEAITPPDIQSEIEAKADLIVVESPVPGEKITNSVDVRGIARGYWFFEASFPLVVTDWDGKIIGRGYATANDNWMTEDFVAFTGTVTFDLFEDTPYRRGTLILQKANASGLPEHDDALEIPITF